MNIPPGPPFSVDSRRIQHTEDRRGEEQGARSGEQVATVFFLLSKGQKNREKSPGFFAWTAAVYLPPRDEMKQPPPPPPLSAPAPPPDEITGLSAATAALKWYT